MGGAQGAWQAYIYPRVYNGWGGEGQKLEFWFLININFSNAETSLLRNSTPTAYQA